MIKTSSFNQKGITLIEILVSLGLFLIMIGAILTSFVSAISQQKEILAYQELLNQASFIIEYMSRTMRTAKKAKDATCINIGSNYKIIDGGNGIQFLKSKKECYRFYLDNNRLKLLRVYDSRESFLTSDDLEIEYLKFNLMGETQEDYLQPRVTVTFKIKKRGSQLPAIRIQTTISQRDIDIKR